ncbi:MAG: cysteine hydrolase [Euryarchaeota archaeon]|nr:cysteine hydrolase [Euryarchaeota archaeon]
MKALLVIDMLKDFVNEDGRLVVPGAGELIGPINRQIRKVREGGGLVIFVCDAHDRDDREFRVWPPHAIEGTRGAEVIDELDRQSGDPIIKKKRYSAFYNTDLEEVLEAHGVDHLLLAGVLTDICVMHTAVDAAMRDYRVTVLEDCVKSASEEAHRWALKHMKDIIMEVEIE